MERDRVDHARQRMNQRKCLFLLKSEALMDDAGDHMLLLRPVLQQGGVLTLGSCGPGHVNHGVSAGSGVRWKPPKTTGLVFGNWSKPRINSQGCWLVYRGDCNGMHLMDYTP